MLGFQIHCCFLRQLWLVAFVFMILDTSTTTVPMSKESQEKLSSNMAVSLEDEVKKPSATLNGENKAHKPNGNHTSIKDWLKHNKKKAAIGMIVGVTIAVLVIVLICCCISKIASEKIKRKKKKKNSVSRGILRKFKMPKFKMPKLTLFQVQPKGGFGKEIKNIGSLRFSLFYEKRTGELYIKIKSAEDLSLKSSAYVSFNFVEVELDPFTLAASSMGERNQTKRVRNSICPIFNEVIIIKILPQELKDQELICSVFDENRTSPRDLIGVVTLELSDVDEQISGKEKDFHETLKWRSGSKGGEILLSFRWNPRDETFYVTVKECMNLSVVNVTGEPNPYVKVEVFDGATRVFQETTDTKSKTSFPVFNEIFTFGLTDQQKKTTCLIISVKHSPGLFGKKSIIGQLSFSFRSIGEELKHWKTTLSSGNDVAMMHPLRVAVEVPRKHRSQKSQADEIVDVLTDEENLEESDEDHLL